MFYLFNVGGECARAHAFIQTSEGNLQESGLSFYNVGPGD